MNSDKINTALLGLIALLLIGIIIEGMFVNYKVSFGFPKKSPSPTPLSVDVNQPLIAPSPISSASALPFPTDKATAKVATSSAKTVK